MSKSLAEKINKKPKLSPRQQTFVTELLSNKNTTLTAAAKKAYQSNSDEVAAMTGSRLMSNDKIISALAMHNDLLEGTLLDTVTDWGHESNTRRREIAQNAAMYMHDKVHGKATQRIEQQSVSVDIAIDLT